jgi:hypothetical protein
MVFSLLVGGVFHIKSMGLTMFDLFLSSYLANKWYQSFALVICVLGFPVGIRKSMAMKYNLAMLDFDTWFSLWQVKVRAVLMHHDLDEAIGGFRKKDQMAWTPDEMRKDHKALSMIHLQLSNNVL